MTKEEAMKKYDLIERPKVEVVEVNEWGEVFHCVAVNDRRLFLNSYKQNDTDTTVIASDVAQLVCDDLTKALVGGEG